MIMEHKLSSSIHSRIKKTVSLEVIILQVNLLGGGSTLPYFQPRMRRFCKSWFLTENRKYLIRRTGFELRPDQLRLFNNN